jgi:hypothetical protein
MLGFANRTHQSFIRICCLLLFCLSYNAAATTHTDSWNTAIITGSLTKDKKLKYYLQPSLNFEDDQYKYRSSNLYLGLGVQSYPNLSLWLMNGWNNRLGASGKYRNTDTIRQQANWGLLANDLLSITSITRLEERKDYSEPEWSLRFRERMIFRFPLKNWERHSIVTFDEIYLNLNNPPWVNSNSVFSQNHIFLGIGTQLSPFVSFDFGYMNQYLMRLTGNQDNNIIYLAFNVALP